MYTLIGKAEKEFEECLLVDFTEEHRGIVNLNGLADEKKAKQKNLYAKWARLIELMENNDNDN